MIHTLTLLLVFQLVGELLVRALVLPIPGPVIGMVLLFLTLLAKGRIGDEWLPITIALVVSTFAKMAVTALVLKAMTGRHANEGKP